MRDVTQFNRHCEGEACGNPCSGRACKWIASPKVKP